MFAHPDVGGKTGQFLLWNFQIWKLYRHILRGLAVVLKDDSDVHVDDDEEADDEVREQVGDGNHGVATVALVPGLGIRWN